jgi:hypothetical protein
MATFLMPRTIVRLMAITGLTGLLEECLSGLVPGTTDLTGGTATSTNVMIHTTATTAPCRYVEKSHSMDFTAIMPTMGTVLPGIPGMISTPSTVLASPAEGTRVVSPTKGATARTNELRSVHS